MNLLELLPKNDPLILIKAGRPIFTEGETSDVMFILFDGQVDITVGTTSLGTYEAIEVLGEMSAITPGPRGSSVVARTDCRLTSINQGQFMMLLRSKPEFAIHILQMLVERMRSLDQEAKAHAAGKTETITNLRTRIQELKANQDIQADKIRALQTVVDAPPK